MWCSAENQKLTLKSLLPLITTFFLRMETWLNIDIFYFASTATKWAKKKKALPLTFERKIILSKQLATCVQKLGEKNVYKLFHFQVG